MIRVYVEVVEFPSRAGLVAGLLGFYGDAGVTGLEVLEAGRLLRVTRSSEPVDDVPVAPVLEQDPDPEPDLAVEAVPSSAEVRAWAKDQGLEVPARGRVPADIVTAYTSAQS